MRQRSGKGYKDIKWEPHGGSGGQEFDDYLHFGNKTGGLEIHQLQVRVGETLNTATPAAQKLILRM
jgi:hypothetical protein